jgi:hypothetical protein
VIFESDNPQHHPSRPRKGHNKSQGHKAQNKDNHMDPRTTQTNPSDPTNPAFQPAGGQPDFSSLIGALAQNPQALQALQHALVPAVAPQLPPPNAQPTLVAPAFVQQIPSLGAVSNDQVYNVQHMVNAANGLQAELKRSNDAYDKSREPVNFIAYEMAGALARGVVYGVVGVGVWYVGTKVFAPSGI